MTSKSLTILAIDDDPSVLALYRSCLCAAGHTVETAADGAEGLARFKEGGWDLVLTDRTMPKLNGDELAAAVKAIDPRMPIVMVSGSIEELPEAIGKRRAVDVFVHKPFTLDALTSAIAKARESAAR